VSPHTRVLYAPGCAVQSADRSGFEQAVQAARAADAVILVVGDKSGLTLDCTCGEFRDRADLGLPGVQQELVETIAALGKPSVVVLVNGRPLSIPWIAENIPALLEAWLPGEEGGAAIADALFGDVNPGGKLPISFPRSVGQIPLFYNHKPSGGRSQGHGDYVSLPATPLFPFGHGSSYTQFEYTDLLIDPPQVEADKHTAISLKIKNTGARIGDEVVQLYVRDQVASLPRPVKELKGFKRIQLAPGEIRTVAFDLWIDQLAFYDEAMQLIVEPGMIQVMIGSSSEDIRLRGSFQILGNEKRRVNRRVFTAAAHVR
jgi:beta-glucosidase